MLDYDRPRTHGQRQLLAAWGVFPRRLRSRLTQAAIASAPAPAPAAGPPADASRDDTPRNSDAPRLEPSAYLKSMVCPITHEAFRDPVIAEDGHSYERAAIVHWLRRRASSPSTGAPMGTRLLPNHALRNAVEEYTARQEHT